MSREIPPVTPSPPHLVTPSSSSPCPSCSGPLGVYFTRVVGNSRIRYFRCRLCRRRPESNKQVVPLAFAPRRAKREALALAGC